MRQRAKIESIFPVPSARPERPGALQHGKRGESLRTFECGSLADENSSDISFEIEWNDNSVAAARPVDLRGAQCDGARRLACAGFSELSFQSKWRGRNERQTF